MHKYVVGAFVKRVLLHSLNFEYLVIMDLLHPFSSGSPRRKSTPVTIVP